MMHDNHTNSSEVVVTSFYKFFPIESSRILTMKLALENFAAEHHLCGQIILAAEGINATVAGSQGAINLFQQALVDFTGILAWDFKNSIGNARAFRKFVVKVRPETVTSSSKLPVSSAGKNALSPEQWNTILENEDCVVLDVRNWYEAAIGKFCGAEDLHLNHFKDLRPALLKHDIPRDKKVLTYCTGGIRCEKAISEMERLGYRNIFQLQGGILNYLEQFPNKHFQGECFVFDDRVSLGQDLQPTNSYAFCPHCGQPAKERISCEHCGVETRVCDQCTTKEFRKTCSLDCAYRRRFQCERRRAGYAAFLNPCP